MCVLSSLEKSLYNEDCIAAAALPGISNLRKERFNMNRLNLIEELNQLLLQDMPWYREQAEAFGHDETSQRRLLRSLMNVREPAPLNHRFLELQDELLQEETREKGVVNIWDLPAVPDDPILVLWKGDITRLNADAIVNAANSALLGCFHPCHGCIDNAIHSAAGLQLREECRVLMEEQNHPEETGKAKITRAWNLPARYVIHTVGPIVHGRLTEENCRLLAECYRPCLGLAAEHQLESIAFCCISTGEFHFPNEKAAELL